MAERLGHVLVSCIRNEGPYLVEFAAHHRVLGFDLVCIASNDCTDGSDALLDALDAGGAIRHLRNRVPPGEGPQHHGYAQMRRAFKLNRAEWLMALDVDEFLHVEAGDGRVQDLTAAAPDEADIIALNAHTFGTAAGDGFEDAAVCRRFTARLPARHRVNGAIKSLARGPARFNGIHNHSMVGFREPRPVRVMRGDGSVDEIAVGEKLFRRLRHDAPDAIRHGLAHYNHYAIKSVDEFILRRGRGLGVLDRTGSRPERHSEDYFLQRARDATQTDRRILDRYGEAVAAETARLLALPGVAAAHAATVHATRAAIDRALGGPG